MASQITGLTIVYSTVYSMRKKTHQSSASLAFVCGIHRWPMNSPHKGPVTREMFPFDDAVNAYCINELLSSTWKDFTYPRHLSLKIWQWRKCKYISIFPEINASWSVKLLPRRHWVEIIISNRCIIYILNTSTVLFSDVYPQPFGTLLMRFLWFMTSKLSAYQTLLISQFVLCES